MRVVVKDSVPDIRVKFLHALQFMKPVEFVRETDVFVRYQSYFDFMIALFTVASKSLFRAAWLYTLRIDLNPLCIAQSLYLHAYGLVNVLASP